MSSEYSAKSVSGVVSFSASRKWVESKWVRGLGALLFVFGISVFSLAPWGQRYVVDFESLELVSTQLKPHQARTWTELASREGLIGQHDKFGLYQALVHSLKQVNDALKKEDEPIWNPEHSAQSLSIALQRERGKGWFWDHQGDWSALILLCSLLGALLVILPRFWEGTAGVKHHGIFHRSLTAQGGVGVLAGVWLIAFYIGLYFYPHTIVEMISVADVAALPITGQAASQWFMYGFLYTLAVWIMGLRMFAKYRHSRYHQWRTASVIFFQTVFAFVLPEIMVRLSLPWMDLKNLWPLDYSLFFDYRIKSHWQAGRLGIIMFGWGVAASLIGVPLMTYFFGKRWYCSWVCGCGGLAETLGDPFRQLSNRSLNAWRIERVLIHAVLLFAVLMSVGLIWTWGANWQTVFGFKMDTVKSWYVFLIGSVFAGVIGTGFYPLMGNRVWCRFGCPLAAYLGIVQRFKSRFRITTNGGQCISCGNCSTYCEMGIDVRSYAQRGENIVRSSCVGCGVCAAVCPRGVLTLENGPATERWIQPSGTQTLRVLQ